jgi:excinuclease ABC subunit A
LERSISIRGARTHNLRNISLDIPHGRLTIVTGVSGSGKSSLVFDTIYAEGQRRYVQSLSTYARLFLDRIDRPDVDSISNIPPALALKQENTIKNARSTVGTITEISDYLRLLFAAVGKTICPRCAIKVRADSVESAATRLLARPGLCTFIAPFTVGSRSLPEVAAYLAENGYSRIYWHGAIVTTEELFERVRANGRAPDTIDVVIDRVAITPGESDARVREALDKSFYLGSGRARAIAFERSANGLEPIATLDFDRRFSCSNCGDAFAEPTAHLFSANSPLGACPECEGFGRIVKLDLEKVLPNPRLSLRQGLVAPWRTPAYREMQDWMMKCARRAHIRTAAPLTEMSAEERAWLLDGEPGRESAKWDERWPGVRGFFRWMERKRYKTHVRILLAKYRRFVPCPRCAGTRLKPEALNVLVDGKTIAEVGQISVRDLPLWLRKLRRDDTIVARTTPVLRELDNRIGYLNEVGLGYLNLERQARTLSGGEAQRIHLASALGSLLSGTLYALDEPTVGLHASDSRRLLTVLRHLRDLGNTVVVVEHDPTMIAGADFLVELGPEGGSGGGNLLSAAKPIAGHSGNGIGPPGRALLMRALARQKRFGKRGPAVKIVRASEHNLRKINVEIPLGRLVCLSGVSGSGKSTLMEAVLYNNYLRHAGEAVSDVGACESIEGLEAIGEVVHMGQEMPTRSLRSNPATYLKIYDDIRKQFASSPEARRLKIKPRDFSFNVDGGRCTHCHGTGTVTIEMHFMADLEVQCDACEGRRFQSHILAIKSQGRNINEVLDLTVDEATIAFARFPAITRRLEPLAAVGLGYLRLGQTTATLSGGEIQRLKLARFLLADLEPPPIIGATRKRANRMFLLDEPTTGLASSDIKRLIRVLLRLVTEGNTVVVIEHNLEFIAQADYVIDLGPGGGDEGGKVVVVGDPLKVAANAKSRTGHELRLLFGLPETGAKVIQSALREAAAEA